MSSDHPWDSLLAFQRASNDHNVCSLLYTWWQRSTRAEYLESWASRRTLWKHTFSAFAIWIAVEFIALNTLKDNRDILLQNTSVGGAFAVALVWVGYNLDIGRLRSDLMISCICSAFVLACRTLWWDHPHKAFQTKMSFEMPTLFVEFQVTAFMATAGVHTSAILLECGVVSVHSIITDFGGTPFWNCVFMVAVALIGAGLDYATGCLFEDSQHQLQAKNILLDQISDGFCTIDVETGMILDSSSMLAKTFSKVSLQGCNIEELVDHHDLPTLRDMLESASGGQQMEAFLATWHGCDEHAAFEFDANIVPYAAFDKRVSVCFSVQGERRLGWQAQGLDLERQVSDSEHVDVASVKALSALSAPAASSLKAPSALSAPAAPKWRGSLPTVPDAVEFEEGMRAREDSKDCLPSWSSVHVLDSFGNQVMKRVDEIQLGNSVQCYDHLQQAMCYRPVTSLDINSYPGEWVEAKLTDGTILVMTSDHPLRCGGSDQELFGCRTVLGGELVPGEDTLRVFKTEEVAVQEVRRYVDTKPKVSIGLEHSTRYSMFVTFRKNAPRVAVESADYMPSALQAKGTFIEFSDRPLDNRSAVSAPAKYHSEVLPGDLENFQSSEVKSQTSCSSEESSQPSVHLLLGGLQDGETGKTKKTSLQETMAALKLRKQEHDQGLCRPCRFQRNYQQDPANYQPCRNWHFCDMCHEAHDDGFFRQYRTRSNYTRRADRRRRNSTRAESEVVLPV